MALFFALLVLSILAQLHGKTLVNYIPPEPSKAALMGRYIIHNSDWVSIATESTVKEIQSYPFANLKSMSDGPVSNGTGVPYMYMSPWDLTGTDIEADNRCTILASLAESDYCKSQHFDPQDPRCARVILTGHLVRVNETTDEYAFAKNALFSRHPSMKYWPTTHEWYIPKMEIEMVMVLDFFGGAVVVGVDEYFAANLNPSLYIFSERVEVFEVV